MEQFWFYNAVMRSKDADAMANGTDPDMGQGYKPFLMLNSAEHEIFLLINVKMPTIVGILTFMSRKNNIIDPEKAHE